MRSRILSFAALLLAVGATSATQAQDYSTARSADEIAQRMKEVATPGPRHADLAKFLGKWDVEIAILIPGQPVQRSKGTAEYSWVIAGRWLGQRIDSTLFGAPYQSFSIMGFDNYAKNHVAVSVTSADTSMLLSRGLVVDPKHQFTSVYGFLDEYTTGELHKPYKAVTRRVNDNQHVMEVWDLGIGAAGAKVMEYTFNRRK